MKWLYDSSFIIKPLYHNLINAIIGCSEIIHVSWENDKPILNLEITHRYDNYMYTYLWVNNISPLIILNSWSYIAYLQIRYYYHMCTWIKRSTLLVHLGHTPGYNIWTCFIKTTRRVHHHLVVAMHVIMNHIKSWPACRWRPLLQHKPEYFNF